MGNRLHVATEYKVEYSLDRFFNYKMDELFDLLSALDVDIDWRDYNFDGEEFEVSKEMWVSGIEKLKTDTTNKTINEAIEKMEESREELIDIFEYLLRTGDPENENW